MVEREGQPGRVPGASRGEQGQDSRRGRATCSRSRVLKVRTCELLGKKRRRGRDRRAAQLGLEKGLRDAQRRRQDRIFRGAIVRLSDVTETSWTSMAVIQLNPRTPGQRFMQIADFSELTKKAPEKSLLVPLKHSGGRNNRGRMTSRHRGGGHKRRLRLIDFKRNRDGIPARGRGARVRSESLGQYRAAALCRRREDATSSRPTGSRSATRSSPGRRPISSRATRWRSRTSRSAPSCMRSS